MKGNDTFFTIMNLDTAVQRERHQSPFLELQRCRTNATL